MIKTKKQKKQKSKRFLVVVKFKTNKDGTVDIISSKNVLKKKRKFGRK